MRVGIQSGLVSILATLCFPAGLAAQETLALPQRYDYAHDHSGIVVPYAFGDLTRSKAIEFHPDQLDVGLTFEGSSGDDFLSVYVFRNTNGAVPVWFAQGSWAIENRDIYAGATPAYQPSLITLPNRSKPTGLKAVYDTAAGEVFASTGLAVLGAGEWYIKVRLSSPSKTPEALLASIGDIFSQLTFPADLHGEEVKGIVADCNEKLKVPRKSKDAKSDPTDGMAALLIDGVLRSTRRESAEEETDREPRIWCRDSTVEANYIAYRADASTDTYLLAIGDNGNAFSVGPDAGSMLFEAKESPAAERFSVTLKTAGKDISFPVQDRLPSPKRTLDLLDSGRRTMTVNTWGENSEIELNSSEF